VTTWLELKRGDVLVDNGLQDRAFDYSVILILAPPSPDDPDSWVDYVSLVTGTRNSESMINPHFPIETHWHLVTP